ncbi:MAG: hypothetical protein ACLFV7_10615, partial [Phycisphaerae bacterium]
MSVQPCRSKWDSAMTDRDRFNAQMHYCPVDRCFNREFGYWRENFSQWDLFVENGITCNREADRFFNFDRMPSVGGNVWLSPPFERETIGQKGDRLIIRNEEGLSGEVPKDGHSTIPHFTDSSVKAPDDWKRIKE